MASEHNDKSEIQHINNKKDEFRDKEEIRDDKIINEFEMNNIESISDDLEKSRLNAKKENHYFDYLNHDYLKRKDEKYKNKSKETTPDHSGLFLMITIGALLSFILIFFVVVVFSMNQVRPAVPVPKNINNSLVNYDEIVYLTNKIGFYKLHMNPLTRKYPVVDFFILDSNQSFAFSLDNSLFTVVNRELENPDVAFFTTVPAIKKVVYSKDVDRAMIKSLRNNETVVRVYSSHSDLILKGYYPIESFIVSK